MNLIIDLEENLVVQGWGNRSPTNPIVVKSQDTPVMAVYFGKGQASYDLGASPGVRFALYVAGSPNALVDVTGFNRTVDSQNKTAYVAYPNFNTTQMAAAMAGLTSLQAIGEIRYQTPFGTIARTLDIPFTVNRSLLQETAYDTTTAAFTVPAVGSSVTVHINHTGWLAPNQNITFGAGGGAYQVVSVTNATDFVAKNLGGTGNASSGTSIPSGTSVGNTPTSALGVYPDPSTIELLTHKNQPSGYAGLNTSSQLAGSTLPVDTTTIVVNSGGKLASAAILAITGANFTTPAAGATVSVTFLSTASLVANIYTRIQIAGYYIVQSITDSTHAVLKNVGDPLNAASGVTITSGAPLLPAQAVSGGGGGGGGGTGDMTKAVYDTNNNGIVDKAEALRQDSSPGALFTVWGQDAAGKQNLFTAPGGGGGSGLAAIGCKTIAAFTWPAVGASVTVNVDDGSAFYQINTSSLVYVGPSYGFLLFEGVVFGSPDTVTLTNSNQYFNSGAGSIAAGATIIIQGGTVGDSGATTGVTLVTDDQAADTPSYPAIKRLVATNSSIVLDSATSDLAVGIKAVVPQESLGAHIESPAAKTYTLDLAASSAYTIKAFKCILGVGTCTLALNQNGTGITGATAISVSTTLSTTTLTQAVAANDKITITLSSLTGSPADLQITMYIQR